MTFYLIIYAIATTALSVFLCGKFFDNNYSIFLLLKCLFLAPVCIALLRRLKISAPSRPISNYKLLLITSIWLAYFFIIPSLNSSLNWSFNEVVYGIIFTIVLVLYEELVFRVLPFKNNNDNQNTIVKHYNYAAIFAIAHVTNFLYTGNLQTTINQLLIAFGLGLILSAIFIRSKNIVLIVSLHFFVNVGQEYNLIMSNHKLFFSAFNKIDLALNVSTIFAFAYTLLLILISEGILSRAGTHDETI